MRLSTKKLTEQFQPGICFIEQKTGREVGYLTVDAADDADIRDMIFDSVVDVIEHYLPNLTTEEIAFIDAAIPKPKSE